ncbi:MAG TPA: DUF3048 C-terminal domain-containing protein, partial [Anaerolineales bacterium]|nr:DUF3048 C-terminal domain-containing protein [Anaerolineales bacterium]
TLTPEPPITFPANINPLTGQPVTDPSLLKAPALLVSISNFPATGRPQAGLSFAPFVYEIYITEGATRFLAVFYGQYPEPEVPALNSSSLPLAQVGPIRSGRLIYAYISDFFKNSCLIYAFASEEVLAKLPQCHMVFHQLSGGGYMMDISEMKQVAEQNQSQKGSSFDYASNIFSEQTPSGGVPAAQLKVYVAYQNQSGWFYDSLYQSYLRYTDTTEYSEAGILHPDTDRLTGRQLHFENVIVLFAKHKVISPTNLDIHLDQGLTGNALIFRDGQMFKVRWSTRADDDRNKDRSQHPIIFLGVDNEPFPLKPGHTWVLVVTPETTVDETSPGMWQLQFAYPPGAK